MKFGTVKRLGFDAEGYERRECLEATCECDCGEEIELWSDTEAWTQRRDGKWKHSEYGPAMGVCEDCQLLFVDTFEGCFRYELKGRERSYAKG